MPAKLNRRDKVVLKLSSREALRDAFDGLRIHFARDRWVGTKNAYGRNTVKALWRHTQPGSSIKSKHLSQYIAASAPLHCADGWGFLGRAMEAHAHGDRETSIHLAYYAELRAAMSLLASEGIGIFDDRHFVVKSDGNCEYIGTMPMRARWRGHLRTHNVVWLALEHWAELKRSVEILAEFIQPNGIPLEDWLNSLGVAIGAGGFDRRLM
jgi:hypothetical protein